MNYSFPPHSFCHGPLSKIRFFPFALFWPSEFTREFLKEIGCVVRTSVRKRIKRDKQNRKQERENVVF